MAFGDPNRTTDPDDRVATDESLLRGILYALMTGGAATKEVRSTTGTESDVPSNAGDVQILAANTNRLGFTVQNESSAVLYLLLSDAVSSATKYTAQMGPNAYYECPFNYVGRVKGIWSSANGSARVTEFS